MKRCIPRLSLNKKPNCHLGKGGSEKKLMLGGAGRKKRPVLGVLRLSEKEGERKLFNIGGPGRRDPTDLTQV